MTGVETLEKVAPSWLTTLQKAGYHPYVATSERLLPYFNTKPFGMPAECFLLENPKHLSFHEAYLLSNSLSFEHPGIKMPHWVLVDFVLLPTAIVGFTKDVSDIPDQLLRHYHDDASIDLNQLSRLPVSGQIASPSADTKSMVGVSLFSLGSKLAGAKGLGLYTKALAFEVYRAAQYEYVCGISQYDNNSVKINGRFSNELEIYQPMVPLHLYKDMSFIYRLTVDFDAYQLEIKPAEKEPTFWLNARDKEAKQRMEVAIKTGKRFIIAPPFSVKRDGEIFLPIIEKETKK